MNNDDNQHLITILSVLAGLVLGVVFIITDTDPNEALPEWLRTLSALSSCIRIIAAGGGIAVVIMVNPSR